MIEVYNIKSSFFIVIVVGVLGRLSSDFGLQFGEYTIFQHETQIFPRLKSNGAFNSQGYFDLDNMFTGGVSDDYHLQFSVRLPSGMPSSVRLASPSNQQESLGLSYYIYAYVTSASAVEEMLGKQQPDFLHWTRLTSGKKVSKVFLSFSKLFANDPAKQTHNPTKVEASKASFLSLSESNMHVTAVLDKPCYQYSDLISINMRIDNPNRTKINSIKVNVKQLVTIKVGNDPKNVIKTCLGRYVFSSNKEMLSQSSMNHFNIHSSLDYVAVFSDTLKIKPSIDPLNYLYQLALEPRGPKSEQGPSVLAPSTSFEGNAWPLGGGLDRIRVMKVEYYMNIHVDIPWSKDVVLKVPFKMVNYNNTDSHFATLPNLTETLNAPIFNPIVPLQRSNSRNESAVLDDLRELRPVPSELMNFQQVKSNQSGSPIFEDRKVETDSKMNPSIVDNPMIVISPESALKEDVIQAKSIFNQLRVKLSEEQHLVLQNVLDSHSLLLRFDHRRQVLVKEFLNALEEINTIWIPHMSQKISILNLVKSFENLAMFDPISDGTSSLTHHKKPSDSIVATSLVKSIVGRLGMFHSQLATFHSPHSVQESKLEDLNNLVDDLELMLARSLNGLSSRFDDAGNRITAESIQHLLTRMQAKSIGLLSVIPLYDKFDEELFRLKSKIACFGMLEDSTDHSGSQISTWGTGFDAMMENLAVQFESITSFMANPSITGSSLVTLFSAYVTTLIDLLNMVPTLSDTAGVAFFWQWQFLHAVVDAYYCDGQENSFILPDRKALMWSLAIRAHIPPQWDVINTIDSQKHDKLQLIGNRVIISMQQLVDAKY